MFCGNCGKKNPDGAAFCFNCGAALSQVKDEGQNQDVPQSQAAQDTNGAGQQPVNAGYQQPENVYQQPVNAGYQQPATGYQQPATGYRQPAAGYQQQWNQAKPQPAKKSGNGLIIGIIIAVVVVAVLAVGVYFIFFRDGGGGSGKGGSSKSGPEGVAEDYIKAVVTADIDGIIDLIPDEVFEATAEENDMTVREAKSAIKESLEYELEDEALFDEIKVSTKVGKEKSYSRSAYSDVEYAYDEIDVAIDDATRIEVDLELTYDGDKASTDSPILVPVVQIDGQWYADFASFDDMVDSMMDIDLTY